METLDYLIAKGLIDTENQAVSDKPFKVVKSGVIFQPSTACGIPYDITISWLQKAVRRGNFNDAIFCAYQIYSLDSHELNTSNKTMFRSHLLNRCAVMVSEDIGPADNVIIPVFERYWKLFHKDVSDGILLNTISEILYILCHAKKSRYNDWAFHIVESEQYSNLPIFYTDDFLAVLDDCINDDDILHSYLNMEILEVQYLYKMYKHRTKEYGMLFIVHAILASVYPNIVENKYCIDIPDLDIKCTDLISNRPVLNDAIDMHTYWGRKYLGRDMYYFVTNSSLLEDHHPFRSEPEITAFYANLTKPVYTTYELRPYQIEQINKIGKCLNENTYNNILLNMATGTGKTYVSYKIAKNYDGLVMFVFPTLDILDQTVSFWSKICSQKTIVGILASNRSYHQKHLFNYEYIDGETNGVSNFDSFMDYDTELVGKKVIFCTYSSLSKKRSMLDSHIDLVIYDEGHHISHDTDMLCDKIILSATPVFRFSLEFKLITQYDIGEAISDGFLTPFELYIIKYESYAFDVIRENSSKTIVYSKNNFESKSLHSSYPDELYIDCKIAQRRSIIQEFDRRKSAILFNCSIMGEGVDVPSCDSIYFHSGRKTYKTVVQAIGRCLRKCDGKEKAKIFMCMNNDLGIRLKIISQLTFVPNIVVIE